MAARRDSLPLLHLVPNLVTITGLCAGLTAIRYSIDGRFTLAVALIVFAAVIDGLDGLIARRLRATSEIGAELDSLSDFVCFGVAPAIIVHRFAMHTGDGIGWVFALVYAIACCLRLARFNVMRDQPEAARHFVGVPAPAGAGLALWPIFATFAGVVDLHDLPLVVGLWLGLVGLLMISRIPTPSIKGLRVPRDKAVWVLVGAALVAGLLVTQFWLLMFGLALAYLVVVIAQALRHRRF